MCQGIEKGMLTHVGHYQCMLRGVQEFQGIKRDKEVKMRGNEQIRVCAKECQQIPSVSRTKCVKKRLE